MNNIIILAILGGGFFIISVIVGIVLFFVYRKSKKKYPFLLYNREMTHYRTIHAKIKIDSNNPTDKKFVFSENDTDLPIMPPTVWVNGVAHREIVPGENGEYCYIEGKFVNHNNYKEVALTPEEKEIALFRIERNNKRYENPMSKYQAVMLITGFVLVLIILIGVVYVTATYIRFGDKLVQLKKADADLDNTRLQVVQLQNAMIEQMAIMTGQLQDVQNTCENRSLVRQLT